MGLFGVDVYTHPISQRRRRTKRLIRDRYGSERETIIGNVEKSTLLGGN